MSYKLERFVVFFKVLTCLLISKSFENKLCLLEFEFLILFINDLSSGNGIVVELSALNWNASEEY